MAFVSKPNTGALFTNKKSSPNQPDVRGDIYLDRSLVKKLMSGDDEMIKIAVSGWRKDTGSMKFLSLALSEPYKKVEQDSDDEDIPF
jgi:hypothetical protein